MKTKLLTCLIIITSLLKNIQAQQWVYNNEELELHIIYTYELSVNEGDSSLLINLAIEDGITNSNFYYGVIELNNSNVHNNEELQSLLITRYQQNLNAFGKNVLLVHQENLEQMIKNIKDTINPTKQYSYAFQGICIYLTILNAAKRDLNGSGDVEFHILDSYNTILSSFGCDEDFLVNIAEFKEYLNNRKIWDSENDGINYYLEAFNNYGDTVLNKYQIHQILEDYFASSKWPPGTACGCCGNYSGPCLFWSYSCLLHDRACESCQWLLCFPGCVPSSCAGNSINLFF